MRILALWSAAMAALIWWRPMDRFSQSLCLCLMAWLALALRSSWKRLEDARRSESSPAGQDAEGAGQP